MAETPTNLTGGEKRIPVVHLDSEGFHPEDADGQWIRITEAIRQGLTTQPRVRAALASLIALPVSETLPKKAVDSIVRVDERVRKLTGRYRSKLGTLLDLPPVPDDQIFPDIRHSRRLETISDIKKKLELLGHTPGSPLFEEYAEQDIQIAEKSGRFSTGITSQEWGLVVQRYRFARDVKILALGAEILEQPEGTVKFDESGKLKLPSGVEIAVDTNQVDQRADMLNPLIWEKRKQLKDRVYEIEINGRKYILKEKKTHRYPRLKPWYFKAHYKVSLS